MSCEILWPRAVTSCPEMRTPPGGGSPRRARDRTSQTCFHARALQNPSPDRTVARLRLVGLIEGVSFLALLGIAMPLKYLAQMPLAVKYVGAAHGFLFILYVLALGHASAARLWPLRVILALFAAAVVPFGTFAGDRWLRRQTQ
jgi:integral membrane protein